MPSDKVINSVDFEVLSPDIVACIQERTRTIWEKDRLGEKFVNKLLREDVLDLLDRYCTVIYFPLDDEENNGFHITDAEDKDGKPNEFVFINTAQTMEKQVFTAAHELGHIWNIDAAVAETLRVEMSDEMQERVMNRFAAELLMPDNQFIFVFLQMREDLLKKSVDRSFSVANMVYVIAGLMNEFFVPYKSVIRRLYELKQINKRSLDLLSGGHPGLGADAIKDVVSVFIKENGYIKLQQKSEKKWIDGFAELLEDAEKKDTVSKSKIEKMRKTFSLETKSHNKYLEESLTLESDKDMPDED